MYKRNSQERLELMSLSQHCVECNKMAVVLNITVPYCTSCYSKKRFQNSTYRVGHLSKTKVKNQYIEKDFFVKNEWDAGWLIFTCQHSFKHSHCFLIFSSFLLLLYLRKSWTNTKHSFTCVSPVYGGVWVII